VKDWLHSLAFWKGISYLGAGIVALLVFYGVIPDNYLYGDAAILAAIVALLNFLGVTPELRSKGLR